MFMLGRRHTENVICYMSYAASEKWTLTSHKGKCVCHMSTCVFFKQQINQSHRKCRMPWPNRCYAGGICHILRARNEHSSLRGYSNTLIHYFGDFLTPHLYYTFHTKVKMYYYLFFATLFYAHISIKHLIIQFHSQ